MMHQLPKPICRSILLLSLIATCSCAANHSQSINVPQKPTPVKPVGQVREEVINLWDDFTHLIKIARPELAIEPGKRFLNIVTDDELIWLWMNPPRAHKHWLSGPILVRGVQAPSLGREIIKKIETRIRLIVKQKAKRLQSRYVVVDKKIARDTDKLRWSTVELWQHMKLYGWFGHDEAQLHCGKQFVAHATSDEICDLALANARRKNIFESFIQPSSKDKKQLVQQIRNKGNQAERCKAYQKKTNDLRKGIKPGNS